ncbi:hypothetical protein BCV69DRAFT_258356 [Microstroma glucosiphilum]
MTSSSELKYRRKPIWQWALSDVWNEESQDNIQAQLRQQLLHHILNYTLPYKKVSNISDEVDSTSQAVSEPVLRSTSLPVEVPDMHTTLHFPSRKALHSPTRPGPIPQPPDRPRHPGADDEGGLLGGEGQKVRTVWKWQADEEIVRGQGQDENPAQRRGSLWFDVGSRGQGGVPALKSYEARGGLVIAIDGVVQLPPSLEQVVRTHKSLSLLSSLVEDQMLHSLSLSAHSTFFLPTSASFSSLDTLQASYLLRNISLEEEKQAWSVLRWDRTKLLGWHVSGRGLRDEGGEWGAVGYASRLRQHVDGDGKGQLATILGGPLHYSLDSDDKDSPLPALLVASGRIVEEDILTENGVVHLVDRILAPSVAALQLNVEKTLLALNASRFVAMMKKVGLQSYLLAGGGQEDDADAGDEIARQKWTFVVPNDEAMDGWLSEHPDIGTWWRRLEKKATTLLGPSGERSADPTYYLAKLLKYHIIGGLIHSHNLTDGGLVATELQDWRLKEGRQQILVAVSPSKPGHHSSTDPGDAVFGDANVIAPPVVVSGTDNRDAAVIYLVSKFLTLPDNPVQTAVTSSLTLSTFVAAVFSAELDTPIRNAPGITYFVPNNDAFTALGLVMSYLLLPLPASRKELRNVVEYHAVDKIVYVKDFEKDQKRYPTLEGSQLWAVRDGNGSIEVRRENSTAEEGYTIGGRPAKVRARDLLTSTGVLHEIDRVELPPDLAITSGKLLKGAKCETFRDLVVKAGYGFVLNGTAPSESQQMALQAIADGEDPDEDAYLVLAPTDAAFARVNLTYYLSNKAELQKLIQLHILPSPGSQDEDNLRAADEQPGGGKLQLPFGLRDEIGLNSLLDKSLGGSSRYGRLAFRKLSTAGVSSSSSLEGRDGKSGGNGEGGGGGDDEALGWMVGIYGSRGSGATVGASRVPRTVHAAHLLKFGRESLPLASVSDSGSSSSAADRIISGVPPTRGIGGVFTIDQVLIPYEPNWFHKWGWIVLTTLVAVLVAALVGYGVYRWWVHKRGKGGVQLGEAMEGEEE